MRTAVPFPWNYRFAHHLVAAHPSTSLSCGSVSPTDGSGLVTVWVPRTRTKLPKLQAEGIQSADATVSSEPSVSAIRNCSGILAPNGRWYRPPWIPSLIAKHLAATPPASTLSVLSLPESAYEQV
jgi:hypothetical protein